MSTSDDEMDIGEAEEGEEEGEGETFTDAEMRPTKSDPVVVNLSCCRYEIVFAAARAVGWTISEVPLDKDKLWTVWWMDKSSASDRVRKLMDYQRINHFPLIDTIARKHKLTRVMRQMSALFPTEYDFYPQAWELPRERRVFYKFVEEQQEAGKDLTFIIKPNADSCSRGIKLTRDPAVVEDLDTKIIQLYIPNPLLLEGQKFDLRVYLFMTSMCPLTLYMFNEGIVRICCEPYKPPSDSNIDKKCMHFTNFTLNKKHKRFQAQVGTDYAHGHKRDFAFLRKWLREEHGKDPDEIFASIADVLVKTAIGGHSTLETRYKSVMAGGKKGGSYTCFEILGFDIMLDENFHPWLLEVNHSPSYNLGTPMDRVLKLSLISEAFRMLGIDPKRRKKSLRREKLESRKRVKRDVTPEQLQAVAPMTRRREAAAKRWAERKYRHRFTRIYPVEGCERYAPFFDRSPPIQIFLKTSQKV